MTGQATTERECPRCGTQLPEFAKQCHGCSLRLDPGVAYFEPQGAASPTRDSGSATQAGAQADEARGGPADPVPPVQQQESEPEVRYDRRTVTCLPMDLERVARAEAVDGWALLDTTVDPDRPGSIVAHFRRPAREGATAAAGRRAGGTETRETSATDTTGDGAPGGEHAPGAGRAPASDTPGADSTAAGKAKPKPAPARAPMPQQKPEWQYLLYVGLLVLGVLMLLRLMGPVGLLVALFVLPGILRSALGMPSRKRKSKRRRKKRKRR